MQFIFGSDNVNGYELLWADDYQDAGKVVDQIKFPGDAHVDACGFITFGPNGNRPLFFRRRNDVGYSREAYYIHGVYGKPEDGYFVSNKFKQEFFCKFAEQDWINGKRAGVVTAYMPETDTALMIRADTPVVVSDKAKREILSRLFAGENLVLSVDDKQFSSDYARLLMWDLFSYMPQSVIKSTTFITAVVDAPGFRVRILPESLARVCRDTVISVSDPDHTEVEIPQFTRIVREIMKMHDGSKAALEKLYADYHEICNGYSANYKPKQFCEFMEAYFEGNPELTYKLLDEYFSVISDPSPDTVPLFIKKNLEGHLPALEKPASLRDLMDAAAFIKSNADVLKVLYSVEPEKMAKAVAAMYAPLSKGRKTDEAIAALKELLPLYDDRIKTGLPAYQRLFYETADLYLKPLAESVRKCEQLQETVNSSKRAYKAKLERTELSESREDLERERFYQCNQMVIHEAAWENYDIEPFVRKAFDEIVNTHREIDFFYGSVEGFTLVTALNEQLNDDQSSKEDIMRTICGAVRHCKKDAPALQKAIVRFVLDHDKFAGQEVSKEVTDQFANLKIIGALSEVAQMDILAALDFAAAFLKYDIAVRTISKIGKDNKMALEEVEPKSFAAHVKTMSANLAKPKGTYPVDVEMMRETWLVDGKFYGKNAAHLYKALEASRKKRPRGKKAGISPVRIALLATICLLAVALIIGIVLLVFGGSPNNDASSGSTATSIAQSSGAPAEPTASSSSTDSTEATASSGETPEDPDANENTIQMRK